VTAIDDRQKELETTAWKGPKRRFDIVKEGVIALVVIAILTLGLAALFGSPDEAALTFKGWADSAPENFVATTVGELAGTTESAGYGGPYNTNGDGQIMAGVSPSKIVGVHQPVDPPQDFVILPLQTQQQPDTIKAALDQWTKASADQQATWATNLDTALNDPAGANGDPAKVGAGDYGPVPTLAEGLYAMAKSGALDGVLPAPGQFFNTNNTKQILFMGDGSYLDDAATAFHLQGNTWGMVNETGNYPGQQWLIPFSFWYQLPIFNSEDESGFAFTLTENGDIFIMSIFGIMMLLLIFLPFIPGLRSIPRWIPIHRLVWKQYYRRGRS